MHFVAIISLICTQIFAEYCDVGPQRAPGRGGAREPVLQLRDLLLDLAEDVAAADDLGRRHLCTTCPCHVACTVAGWLRQSVWPRAL